MPVPKKNVAYNFYIGLVDSANQPDFKSSPTLATGDFKVSTDGGAFAKLGTLPDVDPDAGIAVKVVMSQSEMNGDTIVITGIDAAGAEWDDVLIYIDTTAVTVDDLVRSTTPANALDVTAGGAAGIDWGNIENKTTVNDLTQTDIQLCGTVTTNTDMRGTNSAALASVCTETRLAELGSTNLPADVDAILADVTGIAGSAMRGTDSGALASVCTETRLAELGSTNLPADVDAILADTGTDGVVISTGTAQAIADEVLSRDVDNVEATMPAHCLGTATLGAVSRIVDNNGVLEIYLTNGTTLKLSRTITTNTTSEPIIELSVGT